MKALPLRLLLGIDQFLNIALSWYWNWLYETTLFGDEDETISSVLGKLTSQGKATNFRKVIDWFFWTFFKQRNHCFESIEYDEGQSWVN